MTSMITATKAGKPSRRHPRSSGQNRGTPMTDVGFRQGQAPLTATIALARGNKGVLQAILAASHASNLERERYSHYMSHNCHDAMPSDEFIARDFTMNYKDRAILDHSNGSLYEKAFGTLLDIVGTGEVDRVKYPNIRFGGSVKRFPTVGHVWSRELHDIFRDNDRTLLAALAARSFW